MKSAQTVRDSLDLHARRRGDRVMQRRQFITLLGGVAVVGRSRRARSRRPM
jgi:hypothetical protein